MMTPTFEQAKEIIKQASNNAYHCPTCGKTYVYLEESDFTEGIVECYQCDHIREEHNHLLTEFI